MDVDIARPILFSENSRSEIFMISYDGFIKNISDSVVRTMKRSADDWIDKYPKLENFFEMEWEDQYNHTMLFTPESLLFGLSGGKLTSGEILMDLEKILPDILYSTSGTTLFEFSLYQALQEKNIKKCIFYRDMPFYRNDMNYIEKMYQKVINKITCVSGGFFDAFNQYQPTTIFLNSPDILFNGILQNYQESELEDKVFIVLNNIQNVDFDPTDNSIHYKEDYLEKVKKYNEKEIMAIASIGNFLLSDAVEGGSNGQDAV